MQRERESKSAPPSVYICTKHVLVPIFRFQSSLVAPSAASALASSPGGASVSNSGGKGYPSKQSAPAKQTTLDLLLIVLYSMFPPPAVFSTEELRQRWKAHHPDYLPILASMFSLSEKLDIKEHKTDGLIELLVNEGVTPPSPLFYWEKNYCPAQSATHLENQMERDKICKAWCSALDQKWHIHRVRSKKNTEKTLCIEHIHEMPISSNFEPLMELTGFKFNFELAQKGFFFEGPDNTQVKLYQLFRFQQRGDVSSLVPHRTALQTPHGVFWIMEISCLVTKEEETGLAEKRVMNLFKSLQPCFT